MKSTLLRCGWLTRFCAASSLILVVTRASAFPHVVAPKETLAGIAERFYGRIQLERVLVAANHLDRTGARGLVSGMVLEVPAVTYHRVGVNETWQTLGALLLGDERRSFFLAESNGQKPWIQPELGQILTIPYNLSWIATGEESLATLAYRFLGSTKQAWALTQYNDLEKRDIVRGEILLLPLSDLPLTQEGQQAAARAAARLDEQTRGDQLAQQSASKSGISALAADVRAGRYVVAVGHGAELLSVGNLGPGLLAHVQRLLLESYVALDAVGPARSACEAFRKIEPEYEFDSLATSPKILAVCGQTVPPAPASNSNP